MKADFENKSERYIMKFPDSYSILPYNMFKVPTQLLQFLSETEHVQRREGLSLSALLGLIYWNPTYWKRIFRIIGILKELVSSDESITYSNNAIVEPPLYLLAPLIITKKYICNAALLGLTVSNNILHYLPFSYLILDLFPISIEHIFCYFLLLYSKVK